MGTSISHSQYYLAIVCPQRVNDKVLRFKNKMKKQYGCLVALRSPAHITLVSPFWLENARESELLQTLQNRTGDLGTIEIQLEDFSHFARKVLFIQVKENWALQELRRQTESRFLNYFGNPIPKDDRPFYPHISIASRDISPGDFDKAWQHFSGQKFTERFKAKAISILKLSAGKWNIIGSGNW